MHHLRFILAIHLFISKLQGPFWKLNNLYLQEKKPQGHYFHIFKLAVHNQLEEHKQSH